MDGKWGKLSGSLKKAVGKREHLLDISREKGLLQTAGKKPNAEQDLKNPGRQRRGTYRGKLYVTGSLEKDDSKGGLRRSARRSKGV